MAGRESALLGEGHRHDAPVHGCPPYGVFNRAWGAWTEDDDLAALAIFHCLPCYLVRHVQCSDSGQRSPRCPRTGLASDRQLVKPFPTRKADVNQLVELVSWLCSRSCFAVCTLRELN